MAHTTAPSSRTSQVLKYMTPVVILSDGYLANSAEPWLIPDVEALERTTIEFAQPIEVWRFGCAEADVDVFAQTRGSDG